MLRCGKLWNAATGPFLFGELSIADAYFAPLAVRFQSYGVELPAFRNSYLDRLDDQAVLQPFLPAGINRMQPEMFGVI